MIQQKQFMYSVKTGDAFGSLTSAEHIQAMHPELLAPVASLTDAQLAEISTVRVVVPPYPQNGYNHTAGSVVQADGVYTIAWEQQETPHRDAMLAKRSADSRKDRAVLLSQSDWTQLADAPLTSEQRTAWGSYRQGLRDVPTQESFPWVIVWPTKPA